ncbi:response regulator transcription factor [Paramicrobacterium chengjingii]|uniref:Response regulator transcription factor n=1 Tax=Paramicrobacterium chengjingii TaxID=2769067 RepID=A0ABX6YJ19_9MICO|nr:response regulator transcription factor [Microbacterium chengjingii]QPZ38751.1 response regulator transcription factor [Microbacterium chengjingii]
MADALPLAFVVDDEPAMLDIVTFALETQGFQQRAFRSGEALWAALHTTMPDLIVLDVMLPGVSGITMCRRVKATYEIPIILLTAKGESADRVAGLEADADDYVVKPFHPRELALRAQRLVRRYDDSSRSTAGPFELDPAGDSVLVDGVRVMLTPSEFKVLSAFISRPDETVPFDELLLAGWRSAGLLGGREMIKTTVYRMRHKIEDSRPGRGQLIESVRGTGYRLITR